MKHPTYNVPEAARGELRIEGRTIDFALEAGQHTAESDDDALVLEHLVAIGAAEAVAPAARRRSTPAQPAPQEEA